VLLEFHKYSEIHPTRLDSLKFNSGKDSNFIHFITGCLAQLIEASEGWESLISKFGAVKNLIILLEKDIRTRENRIDPTLNIYQFQLDSEKNQADFFEFYEIFRKTFTFEPYFNFGWANLSTGEEALLSIYSRLYSISDAELTPRASNQLLRGDIVLLIDEGELYLHPTWQKDLLFQLLNILPIIFKGKSSDGHLFRNIQIILATNSPLMLTDIPASNIVFLRRLTIQGVPKTVVQDSLNDHKQTFAANIHTLLSDSFFMENGFMGKFAALRINEIITELTSAGEIDLARKDFIKKTIQQIGEPIVRHKLMQIFNDKFNMSLDQRIDRIEKFLKLPNDSDNIEE